MLWYIVHTLTSLLLDFLRLMQLQPEEKDAEILLLRQQLLIVRRRQKRGPKISRFEKLVLMSLLGQIQEIDRAARTRLEYLILISNQRRSWAGIGRWSGASGLLITRRNPGDDHRSILRWKP